MPSPITSPLKCTSQKKRRIKIAQPVCSTATASTLTDDGLRTSTDDADASIHELNLSAKANTSDRITMENESAHPANTTLNSPANTETDNSTSINTSQNTTDLSEDAQGGQNLAGGKRLEIRQTLSVLSNLSDSTIHQSVPLGKKEDVFFLVDNSSNVQRRKQGQKSEFLDDCGADVRLEITNSIYGENSMAGATDDIIFEIRRDRTLALVEQHAPTFLTYFNTFITPKLKDNMRTYNQHPTINPKWTNNNSESMNHILKLNNNWQSKPLADLINLIHTEITTQYLETTRSFINSGTYTLTEQYLNFKIPPCVWERKDATSRSRHMARFLTTTKARHQRDVESTDGQLVVRESAAGGKKINQLKRCHNARTTTIKRIKLQ